MEKPPATEASTNSLPRNQEIPIFFDLSKFKQLSVTELLKLAEDPDKAQQITAAQISLFEHLDRMAEVLAKDLSQYQNKDKQILPGVPLTAVQLACVSRQGEIDGRTRLDLAKDLLVASIINYGNLAWNPADPSTSWTAEQNPSTLLSLILLGPLPVAQTEA